MTWNDIEAKLKRGRDTAKHATRQSGRTGKLNDDGTIHRNPIDGLPPNRIWVRLGATKANPAGRGQVAVWNIGTNAVSTTVADAPVEVDFNRAGELKIVDSDDEAADAFLGSAAPAAYNGPAKPPELSRDPFPARNILDFRPRLDASGGLWLWVEAGYYGENYWPGGRIDLSGELPATSNRKAWVGVGYDPATNALVAVTGPERSLAYTMLKSEAAALAFGTGVEPIAAVPLTDTSTSFTNTDIEDLRRWLGGSSGSGSGLTIEEVDGTPSGTPDTLKFPNGTLTDNGDGSFTYTPSGGGGGGSGDYILIRDEQASGTDGGTFTAGSFVTRVLNTIVHDSGGHAAVASNQITLAAGTYRYRVRCPGFRCNVHRAQLYCVTDAAEVLTGESAYSGNGGDYAVTTAEVSGEFTIAVSTVYEVRHRCGVTRATNGLGVASGFAGVIEAYAQIELWRT